MSSPATVTVAGPAEPIECLVTYDPNVRSRRQGRPSGPDDLPDGATVLVHGLASSVADIRLFGSGVAGARVFPHLRGHGGTPMPVDADGRPDPGDLRALADDLRAVLARFGARRALGVSLGAAALARLAADTPDALDRLVLALPPHLDAPAPEPVRQRFEAMAAAVEGGQVEALAALLAGSGPGARRPAVRLWSRRHAAWLASPPAAPGTAAALRHYPTLAALDSLDELARVAAPVLVLAQPDDEVHPLAAAKAVAAALPRATLHELPAGTVPGGDREVLRQVVAAFLG